LVGVSPATAPQNWYGQFCSVLVSAKARENIMDGIIYLVGLIVIVMAILSFLGLH
jgi:hypothetical protein